MEPADLLDPRTLQHTPGAQAALTAEQATLGACLLDPAALDTALLELRAADFVAGSHRIIFEACRDLMAMGREADLVTVQALLAERNQLQAIGGPVALASLTEKVAAASNVQAYTRTVTRMAQLRRLAQSAQDILREVLGQHSELDVEALTDRAASTMLDISTAHSTQLPEDAAEVTMRALALIDGFKRQPIEISTGFQELDEMTQGLHKHEFTVIAGRPGAGKTALCMNIAADAAVRQKKPALVISLEMPSENLMLRLLASSALVDLHSIRSGRPTPPELTRLARAGNLMQSAPLYLSSPGAGRTDLNGIRTSIRQMVQRKKVELVVIDYLGLIQSGLPRQAENRTQEVSYISAALKEITRQLPVALVVAAQLNRESVKAVGATRPEDRRPRLSELRDSGSIEQDADNVILLWREDQAQADEAGNCQAEAILAKQRMGRTGVVPMIWQGRYTRYAPHRPAPSEGHHA